MAARRRTTRSPTRSATADSATLTSNGGSVLVTARKTRRSTTSQWGQPRFAGITGVSVNLIANDLTASLTSRHPPPMAASRPRNTDASLTTPAGGRRNRPSPARPVSTVENKTARSSATRLSSPVTMPRRTVPRWLSARRQRDDQGSRGQRDGQRGYYGPLGRGLSSGAGIAGDVRSRVSDATTAV